MLNLKLDKRERTTSILFLASLLFIFVAIGARWVWLYRRNQPLEIDEAGYLMFSLMDYHGLMQGGLSGYVNAIEASTVQAPLTAALSSLFYCVTGPHVIVGFAVPLLAGAAIIAATYYLGLSLGSRWVAAVSALLTAS